MSHGQTSSLVQLHTQAVHLTQINKAEEQMSWAALSSDVLQFSWKQYHAVCLCDPGLQECSSVLYQHGSVSLNMINIIVSERSRNTMTSTSTGIIIIIKLRNKAYRVNEQCCSLSHLLWRPVRQLSFSHECYFLYVLCYMRYLLHLFCFFGQFSSL